MSLTLKKALYHISSLIDLGEEVTSGKAFGIKIQSALYAVMGTFPAGRGAIFLYEKETDTLNPVAQKGFDGEGLTALRGCAGLLSGPGKNQPVDPGGTDTAIPAGTRNELLGAGIGVFVPLWVRDEFIGAIALGGKFDSEPYGPDDYELLKVIAHQVAIGLHNNALFNDLSEKLEENRKLYEEMRLIYHDTIQAFAAAIDAKDIYTRNHSQRVAKYAVAIARELGWNESDIEGIYIAGFLHDVGKIIISNEVLNKKGLLSEPEMEEVKNHPNLSYDIISKIKFPWKDVEKMIKHHHERPDGSGYPDSISESELSEGAMILILADSFDAMTSDRPYRNRMELSAAIEEVKRCLGSQFNIRVVGAFCRVLEKEINGRLPEPDILPHLDKDFDPAVITSLLHATIEELSNHRID